MSVVKRMTSFQKLRRKRALKMPSVPKRCDLGALTGKGVLRSAYPPESKKKKPLSVFLSGFSSGRNF